MVIDDVMNSGPFTESVGQRSPQAVIGRIGYYTKLCKIPCHRDSTGGT